MKSNMEGVDDKDKTGAKIGEMPVNSKFDQKGAFDGIIDDAMGGGFGSGFMGSTGMEMVQGNPQNKSQGFSNISQFGNGTGKNVINNLK